MWRPDGWEMKLPDDRSYLITPTARFMYEAGADAMLEALREKAVDPNDKKARPISPYDILGLSSYWAKEGYKLVLIPDDES